MPSMRSECPEPGAGEPFVSVVMPCLNEAEGVGVCVEKALRCMEERGWSGEVVVVDNGSTDDSAAIAERAGARVVHERRRGYGAAYRRGFAEARGRYLVMGDADDTYDFSELHRFVEPLAKQEADLVMGTRLAGEILPGAMPWSHRWIGNPILSGMLRLFFRTRISDAHCGMRGFSREAYERMRLRTTGMEFASEMMVNALRERLRVQEIPITYHPRVGESKLNGVSDAWRHVRFMLLFSPSYLFRLPGFALMGAGLLVVAALAAGPRELLGRQWDYHTLTFGSLSLILGYNLVLFDILAKAFSMGAGFARSDQWLTRLGRWFSLERGLAVGTGMLLAGFALEAHVVLEWYRSGYGALMAVRSTVVGATLMVLGVQTLFGSFLASLLGIGRREGRFGPVGDALPGE